MHNFLRLKFEANAQQLTLWPQGNSGHDDLKLLLMRVACVPAGDDFNFKLTIQFAAATSVNDRAIGMLNSFLNRSYQLNFRSDDKLTFILEENSIPFSMIEQICSAVFSLAIDIDVFYLDKEICSRIKAEIEKLNESSSLPQYTAARPVNTNSDVIHPISYLKFVD